MTIEGTAPGRHNSTAPAPSPQAVHRAEQAAKELAELGAAASVRLLDWGFALRLDQRSVDHLTPPATTAFPGLLRDVLAGALPADVAEAVAARLPARADRIRATAQGAGCELVSPWSAPTLLAPTALDAPPRETGLWFSVYEPGAGWGTERPLTSRYASETPALAVFRDDLYCVYQGEGDDPALWWTAHHADGSWTDDQPFPSHHTLGSPALAVYKDRLYCAHRGGSGSWGMALTSYDGSTWSPDQPIPYAESVYGPALAVYQDTLHLAYAEAGQQIMTTTSQDGHTWTTPTPVPGGATTRSPALAVYDGALHLLHSNPKDGAIHWSHLRGTTWTSEGALPGHRTRSNIGLGEFDGKLICVHRDPARQQLWWSSFDGTNWTADAELPSHNSKYGPALAVHRDRTATRTQLLCVHRGHAQRFVTATGEILADENPAGLHELDDPDAVTH
ncbi:sialidase family protein [Streptomyces sp. NPDC046821]|uniref:sialidase family protein n=1 Tax=Streptomyces sp. NPDC046821 TaxID=3154702 RepID=UPI0033E2A65B